MTEIMFKDLPFLNDYENINIIFDDFNIDDLKIETIKTSHDASDSRGFIITEGTSSFVQITDTGYLNQKYFAKLKNKNLYVMESNHDVEMLMHGRYPKWLKSRVLSDSGHLSNESSSYYLSKLVGPNTKEIILAHLSEENNTPEIALETIHKTFIQNNIDFNNIVIAKQFEKTEVIKI
jgi:phosphoribosyl 1,2-cyclic phosphodiesterase